MAFRFHKKVPVSKRTSVNLSKSGPSASFRLGPFSFNLSKRGLSTSLRLGKGLSYRFKKRK